MQYRLKTLFYWTTAIAVVLALLVPISAMVRREIESIQGPPLLVWGRFFAVWAPIFAGTFLFLYYGVKGKRNDAWITYGLIVGVVVGIIAGNVTSLGEWAIDHFNPKLPYRDFRTLFGTICGGIVGAWFGALSGGISSTIFRPRYKVS